MHNNSFYINKDEKFERVLKKNIKNISNYEIYILNLYYKFNNFFFNNFIHFGDFHIEKDTSVSEFLKIIYKPSNVFYKITIVEGWSQTQLNNELSKYFKDYYDIPYENIIADTYFFEKDKDFNSFVKKIINIKNEYFQNLPNNTLSETYTQNEIMVIGSLLEKEGLDANDKRKISSVIFNRLNKKMKLQIDATVLYAITNGEYNLDRNLLLSDLKIIHPYNTYINKGLPPKPISYVGRKTLDIIFENHKSDFLFYFFNKSLNKHIFSKSYENHKSKLNEYRK